MKLRRKKTILIPREVCLNEQREKMCIRHSIQGTL